MRQISEHKDIVRTWRNFEKRVIELKELIAISINEGDQSLEIDITNEFAILSGQVDSLEMKLALSGEYVKNSAILAIHAGAGGTESQDWAEMLMRMYVRWSERKNFQTEILKISPDGMHQSAHSMQISVCLSWKGLPPFPAKHSRGSGELWSGTAGFAGLSM